MPLAREWMSPAGSAAITSNGPGRAAGPPDSHCDCSRRSAPEELFLSHIAEPAHALLPTLAHAPTPARRSSSPLPCSPSCRPPSPRSDQPTSELHSLIPPSPPPLCLTP